MLEVISPRWSQCVVAATGPSLTEEVAEQCRGYHVIAVNDAYRLLPFAEVLYARDAKWWHLYEGCPEFEGEKWSSHDDRHKNLEIAKQYGVRLVRGRHAEGFSLDPSVIHYGKNSGFQAINLAILFGCTSITLVGFDMRVNGKRHFFGDHPKPLSNSINYASFIPHFVKAARMLPPHIQIFNATPRSALECFPKVTFQ